MSTSSRQKAHVTKSQSIEECFEKGRMISKDSREHKELTKSVAECLAKDMLPLYTVEKAGFKAMLKKFNSRYDLPSRSYFSRVAIPALYCEVKDKIQKQLSAIQYFSATTDFWSSPTMEPYLSYTVHYITDDWELKSACLQASFTPEDHTGENIKLAICDTLHNWNLDIKNQVVLTTDNASNIKLACRLLCCCQLSCFSHNLDLAIQKGLGDHRIERVLKVCRKIVASFSYSWLRRRQLLEEQKRRNLPIHKLKADVKTRWGSVYDMIERIIEQKEAIREILGSDRKTAHFVLSWQDNDVLDSVVAVLAPLRKFTDLLAGEKRVTASAIIPLLKHLTTEVLAVKETENTLTKEIKMRVKSDITSRYDITTTNLLEVCTFLDPRFKLTDMSSDVQEKVECEMLEIVSRPAAEDSQSGPPPKKPKTVWAQIFRDIATTERNSSLTDAEKVKSEIETYRHFPNLDVELSPLEWWKANSQQFPLLQQVARKYLSICATSVSSERVFSKGGNIVTGRVQLKPEKVDQLIFLAQNM